MPFHIKTIISQEYTKVKYFDRLLWRIQLTLRSNAVIISFANTCFHLRGRRKCRTAQIQRGYGVLWVMRLNFPMSLRIPVLHRLLSGKCFAARVRRPVSGGPVSGSLCPAEAYGISCIQYSIVQLVRSIV